LTKNWPELIQSNIQPPKTVAEAVDRLMEILSGEEKLMIALMPEDELIDLHFGLGAAIRNAFGLYESNNRLLTDCSVTHPDDAAGVIIRA
jgi:hypothetical protein